jgi:hypothetical protein
MEGREGMGNGCSTTLEKEERSVGVDGEKRRSLGERDGGRGAAAATKRRRRCTGVR